MASRPPLVPRRQPSSRLILTLVLSLIVGLSSVALAAAVTKTITARSGSTSATLSYRFNGNGAAFPTSMLRLAITRGGQQRYDRPVHALLCASECSLFAGGSVLAVKNLEPGGSPDVVLNLYSGGAHCCFITQVYRYDAGASTYTLVQRDFGDPGARIETLAGGPVFFSADDRFAYTFAAFAFSGLPVQIWSFASGRFVDVTRRFPALIRKDAAAQYGAFLRNRKQGLGLGFVAAWGADEDLLGQSALVRRRLAALSAAHQLRGLAGWGQGSTFIAQLQRFLVKTGYTH